MKLTTSVLGIASFAILLISCSGTEFKKTKGGAPYKIFGDNKGEKIAEGNIVKYHITQKIKDSLLSTTYGQYPTYARVSVAPASYNPPDIIMDALLNARKGDSIYIVMAMDTFIKRDPTILEKTPFRKGDQVITTVRVVDVFKTPADAQKDIEKENMSAFNKDQKLQDQKKKDEKIIEDYLTTNNIKTERTTWGTYVQMLTPGQGPKPAAGQFAMLRYTGMDLTGKTFDSNNKPNAPLLPVQIGAGGSIIGFEDGVKQLSKGAKARLYIPSVIGYGEMGSPPVIQPNQNLMFEIEVVDITDTPPPPPPQMQQTQPDSTNRR